MICNDHYAVIDTETGGLSEKTNPICEVAFIILDKDLNEVARHERIIKNYNSLEGKPLVYAPQALAVHGISMAEINAGMAIKDALVEMDSIFKKYCKGASKVILVGHNMAYDNKMIKYAYDVCKMDMNKHTADQYLCTMKMSHMAWGHDDKMENFKLPTCCERIGVNIADSHRGLADVISTVELFKHHMSNLRNVSTTTAVAKRVDEFERSHGFRF